MTPELTRGSVGLLLAAALLAPACRRADAGLRFVERTPHEAYEAQLRQVGLDTTALGREWMDASRHSLSAPIEVRVPHREARFFDPQATTALGYHLRLSRGQRLVASVDGPPSAKRDLRVFLDLFAVDPGTAPRPVTSGDPGGRKLSYKVYRSGDYYLRVQPELLSGGPATIDLATEMGFPVAGHDAGAIKSEFGDPRDGGRREHEGVDIFAPIGTPIIATVSGHVTRVGKDRLGGNVVWLQNDSTGRRMYYAHLSRWAVQEGDSVVPGDTLGFVGNTGNARHTQPHLHFAVYVPGVGAVDPIRQLTDRMRDAPPLLGNPKLMGGWAQVTAAQAAILTEPEGSARPIARLPRGAPVEILAATGTWYLARLPGVAGGYLPMRDIRPLGRPPRRVLPGGATLLAGPTPNAGRVDSVPPGEEVTVLGQYQNRLLVKRTGGLMGWMGRDGLREPRGVASAQAVPAAVQVAATAVIPSHLTRPAYSALPGPAVPVAKALLPAAPVANTPSWSAPAAAVAMVKAAWARAALWVRTAAAPAPLPEVAAAMSAAPEDDAPAAEAPAASAAASMPTVAKAPVVKAPAARVPETDRPADQKPPAAAPAVPASPEMGVTSSAGTLRFPNTQSLAEIAVPTPALESAAPGALASFAGQWIIRTLSPGPDAILSTFRLTATSTTQGWSVALPGRADPIPVQVVAGGDSVVMRGGPYASLFREGATVKTEIVTRLVHGRMEGSQVVRYQGGDAGPDSVVTLYLWGMRSR